MRLAKKILFSLILLFIFILVFEISTRIKYFFDHHNDPYWLVTPYERHFGINSIKGGNVDTQVDFLSIDLSTDESLLTNGEQASNLASEEILNSGLVANEAKIESNSETAADPMIVETAIKPKAPSEIQKITKPCGDYEQYDEKRKKIISYSYNTDCLRGGNYRRTKDPDVFRIIMVGGSAVFGLSLDDTETIPYYLDQLLNQSNTSKYEVINAGYNGKNSEDFLKLIKNKVTLYSPDLIVYYASMNDAFNYRFIVDEQIAEISQFKNLLGSIHRKLHYKWLSYTYLVEKIHFMRQRQSIDEDYSINNELVDSISGIIDFCKQNGLEIVFIKQVIRSPVEIDLVDTLDHNKIERLYVENLKSDSIDKEMTRTINQRYVVSLIERTAKENGMPVVDFIAEFDSNVPKEHFTDISHLSLEGNEILAEYIYKYIKEYVK